VTPDRPPDRRRLRAGFVRLDCLRPLLTITIPPYARTLCILLRLRAVLGLVCRVRLCSCTVSMVLAQTAVFVFLAAAAGARIVTSIYPSNTLVRRRFLAIRGRPRPPPRQLDARWRRMVDEPSLGPLLIPLDHPDQKSPAFVEQAVQVLVFLVRLVNGLVYVPVGELAGLPTLELLVEWIQDLAPAIVIVVVDQRLLPFSLWCLSTSLTAHLITSACSQVNPSAGRSYRSPGQPPTPLLPMLFVPRPFAGIAAASRRHGPGPLQRTDLSVHTL